MDSGSPSISTMAFTLSPTEIDKGDQSSVVTGHNQNCKIISFYHVPEHRISLRNS